MGEPRLEVDGRPRTAPLDNAVDSSGGQASGRDTTKNAQDGSENNQNTLITDHVEAGDHEKRKDSGQKRVDLNGNDVQAPVTATPQSAVNGNAEATDSDENKAVLNGTDGQSPGDSSHNEAGNGNAETAETLAEGSSAIQPSEVGVGNEGFSTENATIEDPTSPVSGSGGGGGGGGREGAEEGGGRGGESEQVSNGTGRLFQDRHKKGSAEASTAGASRTSGASGAGAAVAAGAGGVSVTLLTLDCARQQQQPPPPPPPAQPQTRPRSRQLYLNTPRSMEFKDSDRDMNDLKLIRDFQIRRKYGRRHGHVPPSSNRENNFVDLGLSGTKYFANNKNETTATTTNNNDDNKTEGSFTSSLENSRKRKTQSLDDRVSRLQQNGTSITVSPIVARVDEDLGSVAAVIKDIQSPVPSTFPPISPKIVGKVGVGVGVGMMKAEGSFSTAGRHNGQSPSLLVNHFGFSTIRPDTFSGIRRHHRLNGASDGNDDLIKELEQHAQRQILACQNMGFTHRGSRAAQSVLSLKHTVSPSAFHPSSFFSRHVPRGERGSRSGTPGTMGAGVGLGEGEEVGRSRRRAIHPHPAGKLSMPRLLVPDRQDQAASRRATLPTVNGSSLQVVLAHSLTK